LSEELISGLGGALIGAILAGLFAWWLHRAEQLGVLKQELRGTITSLVDLREKFQTQVVVIESPELRELASGILNTKRIIYIEAAEVIANQIGRHVSSSEYNVLASELMFDSNFAQAEKYFLKALDACRSTLAQITALRALAAFYFGQGPHQDIVKGRKYYQQAVDRLKAPADPYSVFTLGYTYETWGLSELSVGCDEEGKRQVEHARKYYLVLPLNYFLREQALAWLEAKIKKALTIGAPAPDPTLASASEVPPMPGGQSESVAG
jgi:tetratricopeptide (TPR) repeat protein